MAESAPPRRTTGRCLCGAVAYAVDGPLRAVNACHCDECRRVTGSLWHATAAWRDDLTVEDPDERLTWYQSSERARRGFCAACGASLFLDYDGRPYMAITAGTLERFQILPGHLTGFSRLPARHGPRRGLVDHKRAVTTSGGRENPASGGPNQLIGGVAKLARCTASRRASRLAE
jgi:hypothetical protein